MKIDLNYLKYLIMRNKRIMIIYAAISFVASTMVVLISQHYSILFFRDVSSQVLTNYAFMFIAVGYLAPLIFFNFNFNKKQLDTLYALPMTRKTLFNTHYVAGLLAIFIPPSINAVLGMIALIIRCGDSVSKTQVISFFIAYFMLCMVMAFLYSFNCWVVNKVNNLMDAILVELAYALLPLLIFICIGFYIENHTVGYPRAFDFITFDMFKWFCPWFLMSLPNDYFWSLYEVTGVGAYLEAFFNYKWFDEGLGLLLYCLGTSIVFYWLSLKVFLKRKAEMSEQLSKDFFTYPLIINVLAILIVSWFDLQNQDFTVTIIYVIISFVLFMIMQLIASRSTILTKRMFIKYIVIIGSIAVFNLVVNKTYFFGINKMNMDLRLDKNGNVSDFNEYRYMSVLISKDGYSQRGFDVVLAEANEEEMAYVNELLKLQSKYAEKFKNHEIKENQIINSADDKVQIWLNYYFGDNTNSISKDVYYNFDEEEIPQILLSDLLVDIE